MANSQQSEDSENPFQKIICSQLEGNRIVKVFESVFNPDLNASFLCTEFMNGECEERKIPGDRETVRKMWEETVKWWQGYKDSAIARKHAEAKLKIL